MKLWPPPGRRAGERSKSKMPGGSAVAIRVSQGWGPARTPGRPWGARGGVGEWGGRGGGGRGWRGGRGGGWGLGGEGGGGAWFERSFAGTLLHDAALAPHLILIGPGPLLPSPSPTGRRGGPAMTVVIGGGLRGGTSPAPTE